MAAVSAASGGALDYMERGESLGGRGVDSGADSGSAGGSCSSVGIIQLYHGAAHIGERVAEERAQEHVGVACMDFTHFHAHILHDVYTGLESEHYAFLGGARQMLASVREEVEAVD